jgi:hypothetical protein
MYYLELTPKSYVSMSLVTRDNLPKYISEFVTLNLRESLIFIIIVYHVDLMPKSYELITSILLKERNLAE